MYEIGDKSALTEFLLKEAFPQIPNPIKSCPTITCVAMQVYEEKASSYSDRGGGRTEEGASGIVITVLNAGFGEFKEWLHYVKNI